MWQCTIPVSHSLSALCSNNNTHLEYEKINAQQNVRISPSFLASVHSSIASIFNPLLLHVFSKIFTSAFSQVSCTHRTLCFYL